MRRGVMDKYVEKDIAVLKDLEIELEKKFNYISSKLYRTIGYSKFNNFSEMCKGIDIYRNAIFMPEFEDHGYVFFTRPRLNLTTTSIRQDRILSLLDTFDQNSINFAIRFLLDTNLSKMYTHVLNDLSTNSLVNKFNPFIPILSNRIQSLSGWPDVVIETENTEGGYFSENITYPKGHDNLSRNYELQATFSDIQGSVIMMIYFIWTRFLYLMSIGAVSCYIKDIEARRLPFTSSIYRFVMDPSKTYITKWAKATGTFPKLSTIGSYFNLDASANSVEASNNISIPIAVAGKIDYMDPIVLLEFNTLVKRYCHDIDRYVKVASSEEALLLNYKCIPYIDIEKGTNELMWKYDPTDPEVQALLQAGNL
jgi:hypothetical protein